MKKVAIIGAGIFGTVTALELAKSGKFDITIFERANDILSGASTINHLRHHYGFHYPRSKETVKEIKKARESFEKEFKACVSDFFEDYYGCAIKNSKTTSKDFIKFCDDMNLPYKIVNINPELMNKEKIGVCIQTPERVYDPDILKGIILFRIKKANIKIKLNHDIVGGKIENNLKKLKVKSLGKSLEEEFDYVINATYSNFNSFNKWFGFPRKKLQYELVELLELDIPINKKIGLTIMDGEFSSVLPRGEKGTFTLGHVKESVLKAVVSDDLDSFVMTEKNKKSNKKAIIREGVKDFPILKRAKIIKSLFVTRVVKPNVEKTDERPSEITYYGNGMYSIFGGKVITCVDISKKISNMIIENEEKC